MSNPLVRAPHGETLREVLCRLGPPRMAASVLDTPGFGVRFHGEHVPPQPLGDGLHYDFPGTGLEAEVQVEFSEDLRAAVQQVTLTNRGSRPAPPISSLNAIYLPFQVFVRDEPFAAGFGGGLTDGYYPPRAYQATEVSFGKAQAWQSRHPSFARWWTGKRLFRLANDANGLSSNPYLPLIVAGWRAEAQDVGLWAMLEWSARWELSYGTEKDDWRFALWGGPRITGLVIESGETVRLPKVHIGLFGGPDGGREAGLNSLRRYIRDSLSPEVDGGRPWPYVIYQSWAGIEEKVSEALLRQQADRAAELGAEYFEIDAGWYGGASANFADGVGNWERVDELKFPHGLAPFAQYVRSKGMRFGLWFEPERGRRGSDWVRQHPDWYWDIGNPVNCHLDLTQPEVQTGLIAMLSAWIEKLDIRWLRWDYNHSPGAYWDKVDPTGKVQFAYVEGLYRVRAALLRQFANLIIDDCSGGGNRIDAGSLRLAGSFVITDHKEDPHIVRLMQTAGARLFPANYMKATFYVGADDPDDNFGPLELISRMSGALALSGYIANWSGRQVERVKGYLDGYRTFRALLMEDFYALTPCPRGEADWDVVEFVDPNTGRAVVLAYRVRGTRGTLAVFPKRLDAGKLYRIVDPFAERKTRQAAGRALMEKGLRIVLAPESAAVFHLEPIEN